LKPGRLEIALRLGRVSNLPTVWTNVAAGMALAGARPLSVGLLALLGTAASLLYVGGMYLNDAFDAGWDAAHRPERPIPAGHVRVKTVFAAGFGMLGAGVLLAAVATGGSHRPLMAALALAVLIVFYDFSHKGNPLAPVIMAMCRVALYALAALSVAGASLPGVFYVGAGALLVYLVFLSTLARRETLHPHGSPPIATAPGSHLAPRKRGEVADRRSAGEGTGAATSRGPSPFPSPRFAGRGQTAASDRSGSGFRGDSSALHPLRPELIGALVAGIALLDAAILLLTGHPLGSALAAGAFFLTRAAQRRVAGS
jgi:hypothetical protein